MLKSLTESQNHHNLKASAAAAAAATAATAAAAAAAVIRPTSLGNSRIPQPLTSYLICFSLSHHFQSKSKVSESLAVPKTQLVSPNSFPIRIEIHASSSDGSSEGHGLPVVGSPMLAAHSWDRSTTVVDTWKINILNLRIHLERKRKIIWTNSPFSGSSCESLGVCLLHLLFVSLLSVSQVSWVQYDMKNHDTVDGFQRNPATTTQHVQNPLK